MRRLRSVLGAAGAVLLAALVVTGCASANASSSIGIASAYVPQMIEFAGGLDVLGFPAEDSQTLPWEAIAAAAPEIVIVMPCGYDAPRAHAEALAHLPALRSLGARRIVAVDAAAYFSRPGPRLIDGLELLAHILHPDRLPSAPGVALEVLERPPSRV